MNALAIELNSLLDSTVAGRLFSDFGKRMFFPKGIIAQGAEAKEKGKLYDATVGMAYSKGKAIILDAIQAELPDLSPNEAVAYAPTAGIPALRTQWQGEIRRKNPTLGDAVISLPAVVPGLTAGITYAAELFLNPGDSIVCPEMYWENYRLIVEERLCAKMALFNTFTSSGGFDVSAFEEALKANAKNGKVVFVLNFPNNPSGYSPTRAEAASIVAAVKRVADSGVKLCAITDDAYFGLFYEAEVETESLFSRFATLSENVLALKIDGPTKEDYVWGFRSGFMTFGSKGMTAAQYEAIVKKLMGTIRSSVSCAATPTQNILLKAIKAPGYEDNKAAVRELMKGRYVAVREALGKLSSPRLRPMPFNSGYFMCFQTVGIDAEKLRVKLLDDYQIGTIALDSTCLRVAFSAVETDKMDDLYRKIYEAATNL